MTVYQFGPFPAWDPLTGQQVRNATGQLYAVTDAGFTSPLQALDLNGLPLAFLTSGPQAIIPAFRVDGHAQLVWKSGAYVLSLASVTGLHETVEQLRQEVAAVVPSGGGGGGGTVFFGGDANTARPISSSPVVWVGYTGVTPLHAQADFDVVLTFDPSGATTTTTTVAGTTTTTTTAAGTTTTTTTASTTTTTTANTTTFLDSFADGNGTASPAGWTDVGWNSAAVTSWREYNDYVEVVKGSAARWAAKADAFGSATDVDVVAKVQAGSRIVGDFNCGVIVGGSGATSSAANGIMAYLRNGGNVFLSQYINGTAQPGSEVAAPAWDAASTIVYLRLNVVGTTARVKVWKVGDAEPSTWLTTYTITPQTGWVGIFSGGAKTDRFYYFAAAPTGSAATE